MNDLVKYESDLGQTVSFTAKEVKDRLCPTIGDKDLAFVMALCQSQKLNPFTKDVHIVKYGNSPAQIITSKEVFSKRANANPDYEGFEAGVTVLSDSKIIRREGSAVYKAANEILLGGWCRVFVKGKKPFYDEVTMDEYSTGKSLWESKPATMIRKVAYVHCLREAFPDDFQGLYSSEEMGEVGQIADANQNHTSDGLEECIIPEFVEVASDEQISKYTQLVIRFGEMCGKPIKDVENAVINSSAMKANGAPNNHEQWTPQQANDAIQQLNVWITKSEEAQKNK